MTRADWRDVRRRAGELSARQWMLLARTFWLLLVARMALRWMPVRWVLRWKTRPVRGAGRDVEATLRETQWAVEVAARRSPIAFVCFPQCLAAASLLREKGIESRLHYGAARRDGRLVTHTWLEAEGEVLIGAEAAVGFSTLATY